MIKHTKNIEEAVQTLFDGIHEQTWLDKDKPPIKQEIKEISEITGSDDYQKIDAELKKFGGDKEKVISSMLRLSAGTTLFNKHTRNSDVISFVQHCTSSYLSGREISIAVYFFSYIELGKPKRFECPVCYDDFLVEELYTVDCSKDHRFCFDCIKAHIETQLEDALVCIPK